MKFRIAPMFYYLSISFLILGAVFRLQHWPYGFILITITVVLYSVFTIAILTEILCSKKAGTVLKLVCTAIYGILNPLTWYFLGLIIPIIAGGIYLRFLRRQFLFNRKDLPDIHFDSI